MPRRPLLSDHRRLLMLRSSSSTSTRNMPIGHVTTSQFEWLTTHLEEESPEDQDYYIDASTLDMLQDLGGDPALMLLLRTALGSREGIEIGAR